MTSVESVRADLAQRIATAMYMAVTDIDEDMPFSDFGLESVTLARIIAGICTTYGCTITMPELLNHQTLRAAGAFIAQRIEEQVGAGSPAPAEGVVK